MLVTYALVAVFVSIESKELVLQIVIQFLAEADGFVRMYLAQRIFNVL